jgi:hypothetical protein
MKDITLFFLCFGMITLVTLLAYAWLWFLVKRPDQWARWVEKENQFWIRTGIVSVAIGERNLRCQKGLPMKAIVGTAALLATGALALYGCLLLRWLTR